MTINSFSLSFADLSSLGSPLGTPPTFLDSINNTFPTSLVDFTLSQNAIIGNINFYCNGTVAGNSFVTMTLIGSVNGIPSSTSFNLVKTCALVAVDPCKYCSFCLVDGTCSCVPGEIGHMCVKNVAGKPNSGLQPTTFTVLSYSINGYLIPGGESESQIETRLTSIASSILTQNPNVVCLQEVWDDNQRKVLVASLKKQYPYMIIKSFFNGPSNYDSGLFFASQNPIQSSAFTAYVLKGGSDYSSNKGFQLVQVDMGQGTLLITNTHLQDQTLMQAPKQANGDGIRNTQFSKFLALNLYKKITDTLNKYQGTNIYVMSVGNFETIGLSSSYNSFMINNTNSATDVFAQYGVTSPTLGFPTSTIICSSNINALINSIGLPNCALGNTSYTFPSMITDYVLTWSSWKAPIDGIDPQPLANIAFTPLPQVLSFTDATPPTSPLNGFYGGALSPHSPLLVSFTVTLASDPSMAIAIALVVIVSLIVLGFTAYSCSIKKESRPPTENDMKVSQLNVYYRQTNILITKNFILMTRNRKSFIVQLIVPILFVGFLKLLQVAIDLSSNSGADKGDLNFIAPIPIGPIQRCAIPTGASSCITIAYAPGNSSQAVNIINIVASNNGIPANEIMAFNSQSDTDDFIANNPQQVASAVEFQSNNFTNGITGYALQV